MTKYIKTTANSPSYKSTAQSFPIHHAEHEGMNPMFEARLQKSFQVSQPKAVGTGSPWLQMGKAK